MLGSITPLGERGRGQRWGVTVTAYVLGSAAAGAAFGAILGLLGGLVLPATVITHPIRWLILAALLLAGALLDLGVMHLRLPTVRRQVDEQWLGRFRGWVYGLAFGA
jgi:hypothetical protein